MADSKHLQSGDENVDPNPLKRKAGVAFLKDADPLDRAMSYRHFELRRIKLDDVGFYDKNRGGVGIAPWHVHEVIRTNLLVLLSTPEY